MDDVVDVRRAELADWQAIKVTRLTALEDSPPAFGSTLARETTFDDQEWQRRVQDGNWLLAWVGQQPVGLVAGARIPSRDDERHLVAMWVSADHRGTATAAELVEAVCVWARPRVLHQRVAEGAGLVLLAELHGRPLAHSYSLPSSTRDGLAEIFSFYGHPNGWGSGDAGALMTGTLTSLRDTGYIQVHLWTL